MKNVHTLGLGRNRLTDASASLFAESLDSGAMKKLKNFSLAHNQVAKPRLSPIEYKVKECQQLTWALNLSLSTQVGDGFAEAIAAASRSNKLSELRYLGLGSTQLTDGLFSLAWDQIIALLSLLCIQ